MPQPKLALDQDQVSKLFRGIVKKLRNDPDLSRVVKTWRVWDGSKDDAAPPDSKQCPWIRIDPVPMPCVTEAIDLTTSPTGFKLNLCVDGTNLDDIQALWQAVVKALFPGDGTMLLLLQSVRGSGLKLSQPGIGVGKADDGSQLMYATGLVVANVLVSTPL